MSLDWADNTDSDLAGYDVYRSTTSGGPYTQANGALVTTSSYLDSGRVNGTTYYYVVRAVDTSGNESGNSNQASATPSGSTSGTTVSLSGSSVNSGSTWTANVTISVATGGSPDAGVVVSGTWSDGATGTGTCTTGSNGQCTVSMSGIPKRTGSVRFTVDTASITVSKS